MVLNKIILISFGLGILLLSSACQKSQTEEPTPPIVPTPTAATPTATTNPAASDFEFTNPVLDQDFPDPDVLKVGDTYYAYATNINTGGANIHAAKSKDLVNWEIIPDVLPRLPSWAVQDYGWVWAPEVNIPPSGNGYIMYFVDRFAIGKDGTQCIGVATAASPEGPFEPDDKGPLICQVDQGGSIDPSIFVDEDGKRYILWKNDGNSGGGQTWIYIQEISDDGLTLLGEPTRLITADQIWEGVLVEAPTLWKHAGKYYLFYSANAYNDQRYAVGYAAAFTISGPYTKPKDPLIKTNLAAGLVGPGGQDIVIGPHGGEWVLIHGWSPDGYRRLYLYPLTWQDGKPVVKIEGKNPLPMP